MFEPPESPQSMDGNRQAPDTSSNLEVALARRTSPGKAALRAGLIALPVLIALAVVLRALPAALHASAQISANATATAAEARSSAVIFDTLNTITVTSNITLGGTVTLNSTRMRGHVPQKVTLVRGNNTITLTAPPFATHTCTIHAPIPIGYNVNYALLGQRAGPGCSFGPSTGDPAASMKLVMSLSLHDLPQALQRSALATVEGALATTPGYTGTVPVGDYYATGLDANDLPIIGRATEPLTAQLSYSLGDPATLGSAGSNGCSDLLCPGDAAQLAQVSAPVWIVDFIVAQDWRFTTASGEVAGQAAEPQESPSVMALSYDPSSGWKISNAVSTLGSGPEALSPAAPHADPCGAATQILFRMLEQTQGASSSLPLSLAPAGPQGCNLQITEYTSSPPQATFVYMFGVLLAADDGAHNFLPSLPMAPPSEVAAVSAG